MRVAATALHAIASASHHQTSPRRPFPYQTQHCFPPPPAPFPPHPPPPLRWQSPAPSHSLHLPHHAAYRSVAMRTAPAIRQIACAWRGPRLHAEPPALLCPRSRALRTRCAGHPRVLSRVRATAAPSYSHILVRTQRSNPLLFAFFSASRGPGEPARLATSCKRCAKSLRSRSPPPFLPCGSGAEGRGDKAAGHEPLAGPARANRLLRALRVHILFDLQHLRRTRWSGGCPAGTWPVVRARVGGWSAPGSAARRRRERGWGWGR